jgi:hypothetical protein
MCSNDIRNLKIVREGKTIEEFMKFIYIGNRLSEFKKDMEYKQQTYNNELYNKTKFWQTNDNSDKLRIHNTTSKVAFGNFTDEIS